MRSINKDSLPHLVFCAERILIIKWYSLLCRLKARWWGVNITGSNTFHGSAKFYRHPLSHIAILGDCIFNSSSGSNLLGINRPCILSTLKEGAHMVIGKGCGLSGTVVGCALSIVLEENVRCGANTTITDTDWHSDDPRTNLDAPVHIGKNVWLGANVTVLKGVTIGENTLVAAGSIVTRSLPANVVAAGSSAKMIRSL